MRAILINHKEKMSQQGWRGSIQNQKLTKEFFEGGQREKILNFPTQFFNLYIWGRVSKVVQMYQN